jgi:hypothetical protein
MFTALSKSVLSVITVTLVSSLAMAQLTPGPGHGGGGGNPPPKYNPCSVPTDPNCHGGGGHGGGHPGHGGGLTPGPGHGSNPSYPTYPSQPTYPTYPSPSTSYGNLTRQAINGNLGRCTVRTNVQGRYNQFYIGSNFKGNYENGSYGYNQNNQLENAIRSHYQNGRCDYGTNPYPTNPYPNDPSYPSYPDYENNTVLRVQLQRSVYNQALDLRALFGLYNQYTGYRVVSVSASTTPNSPSVTITNLLVNGYVMASERNPGYEIYLAPQERVRLDNSGTRVQLGIQGSTYIQEIQIELSRY